VKKHAITTGSKKIDWISLNNFSTIPVLRLGVMGTILIPVIAITVAYINDANRLMRILFGAVVIASKLDLQSIAEAVSNLARAFLPKIRLDTGLIVLYFGSVSLATGRLIYSIYCPRVIKEHGSYENYLRHVLEISLQIERIKYYRRNSNDLTLQSSTGPLIELEAAASSILENRSILPAVNFSLQSDTHTMLENAESFWLTENNSKKIARYSSVACYAATAICSVYLFFFMAPIRVCYATSFESKCRALVTSISQATLSHSAPPASNIESKN
jgi:hypothetical protein